VSALELYDREGRLVRSIPATQDKHDATKWILPSACKNSADEGEHGSPSSVSGVSLRVSC
jgi:hypothetical protein